MVEWLLQNKANPKATTENGWTPMSMAARGVRPNHEEQNARYVAVIRALERAGVELDLTAAIACNDIRRAADVVRRDPQSVKGRSPSGRPALHQAVTLDRREIAKLLLDNGCDPEIRSEDDTYGAKRGTPLIEAAFWGRLEIAELLVKHGAKVNATAEGGWTALHSAARMGEVKVAELLLKNGAIVDTKDAEGKAPLDFAGGTDMIKLLSSYAKKQ